MSGRSAKVSVLSDKIQGLKFMQRAAAGPSNAKREPKATAAVVGVKANETHLDEQPSRDQKSEHQEQHEQWTIREPSASSAENRVEIVAEPGWNQWLGSLLENRRGDEVSDTQSRMMFGTWAETEKKKQKGRAGAEREEGEEDLSSLLDESDEEIASRASPGKRTSFIKPGSLKAAKRKKAVMAKLDDTLSSPDKQRSGKTGKRRKS